MTGRSFITAAVLLLLSMSTGCCWWAERHCPHTGGVAAYPAPVAPACGCYPAPAYYPPQQPVVAAQPASWSQPRTLTGCTCTCPP
jgi:hypothetical protein